MTDTLVVDAAVSILFLSIGNDSLYLRDGIGYASPIPVTTHLNVLSWVNDTQNPTTSKE